MNLPLGSFRCYANHVKPQRDRTRFCDECGSECSEGHNIPDRAFFCCRCHLKGAPTGYSFERCELCEARQ